VHSSVVSPAGAAPRCHSRVVASIAGVDGRRLQSESSTAGRRAAPTPVGGRHPGHTTETSLEFGARSRDPTARRHSSDGAVIPAVRRPSNSSDESSDKDHSRDATRVRGEAQGNDAYNVTPVRGSAYGGAARDRTRVAGSAYGDRSRYASRHPGPPYGGYPHPQGGCRRDSPDDRDRQRSPKIERFATHRRSRPIPTPRQPDRRFCP
jgi:hypothetical protein